MERLTDLLPELGITYRQADHWCANRYVRAEFYSKRKSGDVPASKGSGTQRRLAPEEARILRIMARLVHAGIHPPKAADLARNHEPPYELDDGVWLVVEPVGLLGRTEG